MIRTFCKKCIYNADLRNMSLKWTPQDPLNTFRYLLIGTVHVFLYPECISNTIVKFCIDVSKMYVQLHILH